MVKRGYVLQVTVTVSISGYLLWNLGHPFNVEKNQMVYKRDIGGKIVKTDPMFSFIVSAPPIGISKTMDRHESSSSHRGPSEHSNGNSSGLKSSVSQLFEFVLNFILKTHFLLNVISNNPNSSLQQAAL
jgi:hypothetical protein